MIRKQENIVDYDMYMNGIDLALAVLRVNTLNSLNFKALKQKYKANNIKHTNVNFNEALSETK